MPKGQWAAPVENSWESTVEPHELMRFLWGFDSKWLMPILRPDRHKLFSHVFTASLTLREWRVRGTEKDTTCTGKNENWHDTLAARNLRNWKKLHDLSWFITFNSFNIHISAQGFAIHPLLDAHLSARQNTVRGDRQPMAIQGERRLVQCTWSWLRVCW